jgi:hypothetical protein
MSSIASTFSSINSPPLYQISNNLSATPIASSGSQSSAAPASDSVDLSQVAQLLQELQQLQTIDPTEFAKIAAGSAFQLQEIAQHITDPGQYSLLLNLVDELQRASESGNLSSFDGGALEASASSNTTSNYQGSNSIQNILSPIVIDIQSGSSGNKRTSAASSGS